MCGVCERIRMTREGRNPYFVKESDKLCEKAGGAGVQIAECSGIHE